MQSVQAPEQKEPKFQICQITRCPSSEDRSDHHITPDETKSYRRVQQKVEVVQEEQEVFERQEDLLQILPNANQIIIDDDDSSSIFKKLLDMLKKEQIKDCVAYLQSLKNSDKKEKEQIKKILNIPRDQKGSDEQDIR
ncbi:unnamed protein product [Paramecium pentaurelia]|uniref:Uncharacterized protein n=1 Tax=Paramecium pentaurelia TaxID=43138 RepID=A0A8S1YI30_9CILI|nr:unnamed protein product [Paramecium pentaurelia]